MDAPNPSATPTFASRTPLHIGAIGLRSRDLDRLTGFYRDVLGLAVLDRGKDGATLGAGGVPLVHLEHRPDAKPDDTREAGPLSHRLPHADARRPRALDPACGAQQGAAHRRLRPRR